MRTWFYISSIIIFILIGLSGLIWKVFWILYIIAVPLLLLGIYDILQRKHTILRNFPLIGHFRYFFELIRPEIHQYLVESDMDGRPFSRERRSVIYQRAKKVMDTLAYGTRRNVYDPEYEWINHSLAAKEPTTEDPRIIVGNDQCKKPYSASILNVSAMSFGALSKNAVMALNWGAKAGHFYQNTGEGGLAPYHLKYGGDLVWQIGTGYFGCRTADGRFSPEHFVEKATHPSVKMIEIKLSQGAKPGHGGILPAAKLTKEIAEIRKVKLGEDVVSPPTHTAFNTPIGLLEFIVQLRELTDGKPVGFKLCVGSRVEFLAICKAMLETNIYPDFITVDGAEGGTGAAPFEFSNFVGTPLSDGLVFVHNALVGANVRGNIRLICSGKMVTGAQIVSRLALGADMCNVARAMMMSVGCVQSLKCNTNRCPTGVATQDPKLMYGLKVEEKFQRAANYHAETVKAVMQIIAAAGLSSTQELRPHHVFRRTDFSHVQSLDQIYDYLQPGIFLDSRKIAEPYATYWAKARPDTFIAGN